MTRSLRIGLLTVAPAIVLAARGPAVTTPPAARQTAITLLDSATLVLDPACGSATFPLRIENRAPGALPLWLNLTPLVSSPPGSYAQARLSLASEGASGRPGPLPGLLEPRQVVALRLKLAGRLAEGSWNTSLRNGDGPIATLTLVEPRAPFAVRLASPSQPSLVEGQPSSFTLENADAIPYAFAWELDAKGVTLRPKKGRLELGPHGSDVIDFTPPVQWFSRGWRAWIRSLFKDEVQPANLVLRLSSAACPTPGPAADPPARVIPLELHLSRQPEPARGFWSYVFLLILLAAGALSSVYLNYVFPDHAFRRQTKDQLSELERQITALPVALASRLRVLAGLERIRLEQQLRELGWLSPDYSARRADIRQRTDRLQKQVALLTTLGALRSQFADHTKSQASPSVNDALEELFEATVSLLNLPQPADEELQKATANLEQVRQTFARIGTPDHSFAAQIVSKLQRLQGRFPQHTAHPTPLETRLRASLEELFRDLHNAPSRPETISPDEYARWDALAAKLTAVHEYLQLRDTPPEGTSEARHYPDFVSDLQLASSDAINAARRFVREAGQGKFANDILQALENRQVTVCPDLFDVQPRHPVTFTPRFSDSRLQGAAACEEWTVTWDFGHPAFPGQPGRNLTETGWSVTHYFPETPRTFRVVARFSHPTLGAPDGPVETSVQVASPQRTWSKHVWALFVSWRDPAGRLLLVLLLAVIALVVGAKEEITKMDLFPALCAVFLMGFGSDMLKRLLSPADQP